MDDRTFDEDTALEWIDLIEADVTNIRENDLYPVLRSWIDEFSHKAILDIGCGQGVCSQKIDLHGGTYTGLDPSPFLVKRAKKLYEDPQHIFLEGSVYKIPFPDNEFEAAFSVATWHLLSDITSAAKELNRVLKPEGQFLIVTADPRSYKDWTSKYLNSMREGHRFEGQTVRADGSLATDILYLYAEDEILNSLRDAGLEIDNTDRFRAFLTITGRTEKSQQ